MRRILLPAVVLLMLLFGLTLILVQSGLLLLPDEVYAELGIKPPDRVTPIQRETQPMCPSSGDIEWLVVTQFAEHWDVSPSDPRLRHISGSSVSAIWRSVSLLCGKYRELGYPIAADFAERYASIEAAGIKFRRDIYCVVKPKLTERELYFWDRSFDSYEWGMITGGRFCGQA